MQKWEYLKVGLQWHIDEITRKPVGKIFSNGSEVGDINIYDYLNKLGKDGWEMLAANTSIIRTLWEDDYVFKRPIG